MVGVIGAWRRQLQKEETVLLVVCSMRRPTPNRILVIQLSLDANETKVFKAHAAPLGLCDNLVNASELLANRQEDGDSLIKSIVTCLHERSRTGILDGLRSFKGVDNRSAVDVGGLAGKNDVLGRPQTQLQLWEEHLKSPVAALTKVLDCLNDAYDY